MKFNFSGMTEEVKAGLDILVNEYGYALPDADIAVNVEKTDKLSVSLDGSNASITYSIKTEFFRALCILIYNIKNGKRSFTFGETRKIDRCGIMIDVSRNAVLKVRTIKDIITRMARMGLNTLMLYTEDVYKLEGHPYFGYMRGAYTKEELKEMTRFADIFGVDMVPCIQTLGHLEKPLRWSAFADVRDTARVLMVDEPKTYELIEDMIKHMRECFTTSKIHLGLDETHDLGFGNYLRKHGYREQHELMARHLKKVVEIAKKYGFEPMIWNDMYFRMNNPNPGRQNANYENPNIEYKAYLNSSELQYYNPNIEFLPGTAEMLPEDVALVYWDYYNINPEIYRGMIRKTKELSEKVVFAGGIWTWNGLSPSYAHTMVSTHAGLTMCYEEGVKEVFACMWGDDGSECSVYTALLGMQLYAEYCYSSQVNDDCLREMFKACTGYDMDAFLRLDLDADIEGLDMLRPSTAKQVLYQDVLQGLFDKNFETLDLRAHYKKVGEDLSKLEKQGDIEYLFELYRQYAKVLERKSDLGIRLVNAYRKNNAGDLRKIADELKDLAPELEKLHQLMADIWYKNNKPFNFNNIDVRLGGVTARIKRAACRINDFLSGKTQALEELEEERLYYDGEQTPFISMCSSNNIMFV